MLKRIKNILVMLAAALIILLPLAPAAQARFFVGLNVGAPYYGYGYPAYYYPPPYAYAPPAPVVYAPPPGYVYAPAPTAAPAPAYGYAYPGYYR